MGSNDQEVVMKNIFKKNHIIITALAIMIVIAGYLSFTNRDTAEKADKAGTEVMQAGDYDEFTQVKDSDALVESEDGEQVSEDGTLNVEDAATEASDILEADATDSEDAEATDDSEVASEEKTDKQAEDAQSEDSEEFADISDEDVLADAKDVSDNGELNLEEGVPGEAVLAKATIDSSYFVSNRVKREQVRSKSKELYMDLIQSTDITNEQKQKAIDGMLELTEIIDKENATEMLLEAKGFEDAVVFISDGKAEVVVNASALTDQQLAIIESVVKEKTGIEVKNIGINPVVVEE